jgi:hypothetical protein
MTTGSEPRPMNEYQRVVVVRPGKSWKDLLSETLVAAVVLCVLAWLVMLVAPLTVLPLRPSYGSTLATLLVVRVLVGTGDYFHWTEAPRLRR